MTKYFGDKYCVPKVDFTFVYLSGEVTKGCDFTPSFWKQLLHILHFLAQEKI